MNYREKKRKEKKRSFILQCAGDDFWLCLNRQQNRNRRDIDIVMIQAKWRGGEQGWREKESPAVNPKDFPEIRSPTNGEQL